MCSYSAALVHKESSSSKSIVVLIHAFLKREIFFFIFVFAGEMLSMGVQNSATMPSACFNECLFYSGYKVSPYTWTESMMVNMNRCTPSLKASILFVLV